LIFVSKLHRIRYLFFSLTLLVIVGLSQPCTSKVLLKQIESTYPGCLYTVETTESEVALTIDDGPDSLTTTSILEVLARYDAHATFFLISNRVRGNEAIISRIVQEGHEIGNHLTNDEPSIRLSARDFETAFVEADSVLRQFAEVKWFRPGSGWYNDEMLSTITKYNYSCALGSVYPFDTAVPWVWFSVWYIKRHIQPGAIIVLHDFGANGMRTAETLSKILPELKNRGIGVVTLSALHN